MAGPVQVKITGYPDPGPYAPSGFPSGFPTGYPYPSTSTLDFNAWGGIADGVTDNTQVLLNIISYLSNIPTSGTGGHITQRPTIKLGPGIYSFSSSIPAIVFGGFSMSGDQSFSTTILWNGTTPFLQFGTANLAPTSYFLGTGAGYSFSNIQFFNRLNNTPASRTGIFIQDNGCGSGSFENVVFFGAQYGFAAAYGADFMSFKNISAQQCDVGVYLGPSSEQITFVGSGPNATFYTCVEGLVLEGIGEGFDTFGCSWVNCGIAGTSDHSGSHVTITQNVVGETTRLGVTILTGPNINVPHNFWGGSFESNAGGLGYQPLYFIRFAGDFAADAIRGLNVANCNIIGGGANVANSAFIGSSMTGGVQPHNITLRDVNYSGTQFSGWMNNVAIITIRNLNIVSGTALLPLTSTNGANKAQFFADETVRNLNAAPTTGYYNRGTFVQNASSVVTTTEVSLGWVRITDGTFTQANVLGTDWSPANALIA